MGDNSAIIYSTTGWFGGIMRTQGERIKKLRKSKGVTQRELANRLGISEQAISKWEKNLSNPSTKNLLQISKIFGVSITYFYQDEETQSKKIARERRKPSDLSWNTTEFVLIFYIVSVCK